MKHPLPWNTQIRMCITQQLYITLALFPGPTQFSVASGSHAGEPGNEANITLL